MFVFIWDRIEKLTKCYCPAGGLVIVAHDRADADALYERERKRRAADIFAVRLIEGAAYCEPSRFYKVVSGKKTKREVLVFPDAGSD